MNGVFYLFSKTPVLKAGDEGISRGVLEVNGSKQNIKWDLQGKEGKYKMIYYQNDNLIIRSMNESDKENFVDSF